MAALTNTQISVTYVGLLKTSANTVLSSSGQQITDGEGNNSILFLSTAGVGIGGAASSGKELDVTGNVLVTGDLQVDNINIDGNTISATSGVVTLANGAIATTQSQNDNSTKIATTAYVDTAINAIDTLAEILAIGNTTGGNNIVFGDSATIGTDDTLIFGAGNDLRIAHNGTDSVIRNYTGGLYIDQEADDNDIIFRADNAAGGKTTYILIDGSTGAVELNHYGVKKLETTSTGVTVTGALSTTTNVTVGVNATFVDNGKAIFGAGSDLQIFHDGNNSFIIDQGTGDLNITSDGVGVNLQKGNSEYLARFLTDSAVELYHDSVKKFETTSTGIKWYGDATNGSNGNLVMGSGQAKFNDSGRLFMGDSNDLQIYHSGTNSVIDNNTNNLLIQTASQTIISSDATNNQLTLGHSSGNWFAKATNSNTLIIGSESNGTNNITLDTTNGGSATFAGNVSVGPKSNATVTVSESGGATIKMIAGSVGRIGTYTADDIRIVTDSTDRLTIDSSGNSTFAGSIGVGGIAASGGYMVDITPSGGNIIRSTRGTSVFGSYQSNNSDVYLGTISNNTFKIITNDTTAITIDSSQNATFAGSITAAGGTMTSDTTFNSNIILEGNIFHKDDTNTYFGFNSGSSGDDTIVFATNNVQRLIIDSLGNSTFAGNVGIGTTNPSRKLQVEGGDFYTNDKSDTTGASVGYGGSSFQIRNGSTSEDLNFDIFNRTTSAWGTPLIIKNTGNVGIGGTPISKFTVVGTDNTNQANIGHSTQGVFIKVNGTNVDYNASGNVGGSHTFSTGNTERLRITSFGQLLLGITTGAGEGGTPADDNGTEIGVGYIILSKDNTNNSKQMVFGANGSEVGSISNSGSTTSFNTSSDYRLKEDLQDFAGLEMVSKIPVYDFKWKADESRSYGVMAHELEEVLPQAVNGEKDAEEMQSVDYSKIVPLLVKSVQEQQDMIQELKKEIEILKNK